MTLNRKLILTAIAALSVVVIGTFMVTQTHAEQDQPVAEAGAPTISKAERAANATLQLFAKGCIEKTKDLEDWAERQMQLKRADTSEIKNFPTLWKSMGYPVEDKLKNMWGIMGVPVWMYQHENNGCTVTSNAYLSPETLTDMFKGLEGVFKKAGGKSSKVDSNNKDNVFLTMLVFNPDSKGTRTYLMARSFKGKEKGIKTVLHYIRTNKNLSM